jgi:short-subunit dehydrogenase involved in D-alanine esterification of teichoic acids
VALFEARVVFVTWGEAGTGGAEALQLASERPIVAVTGRRSTVLVALAEQNPDIAFVVLDAARPRQCRRIRVDAIAAGPAETPFLRE